VSIASAEAPADPHELVLVVEARGDRIAEVRHYGDPLGPVRARASATDPLALGPAGEVALERGAPEAGVVGIARALVAGVEAHDDDAVRALLAEDVVLHDVTARRTRRGRDAYVAGLHEAGRVAVDRQHAGARFVVVEGAVLGPEPSGAPTEAADPSAPASPPQEHGFADVHRVVDGKVAETWRFVNRRGRPGRMRPRP
jgi:ketosteroid isomerase-like protein